jgi:hypothetical protein
MLSIAGSFTVLTMLSCMSLVAPAQSVPLRLLARMATA